jgi:hypothetical protein
MNYLRPHLDLNAPWTSDEDDLLKRVFKEFGTRWNKLASFFPSRSTNNVKGRCLRLMRTEKRRGRPKGASKPQLAPLGTPIPDPETDDLQIDLPALWEDIRDREPFPHPGYWDFDGEGII